MFEILTADRTSRLNMCHCPNFVVIGQTIAEIWRSRFFQNGGRPSSWICCARVWTIRKEHLVVVITVQNLVGIGAVGLVMIIYNNFNVLRVRLENAYLRSKK